MNRAQKIAWFTLVVLALALGLSLAAFSVGYFILGVPAAKAAAGFGFMGIMGFVGLTPILFRKGEANVQCDERDMMIQRNAAVAAYATFWVLFVAAAMIPWFFTGPEGRITVNYLPVDGIRRDVCCHARAGIGHPAAVRLDQSGGQP